MNIDIEYNDEQVDIDKIIVEEDKKPSYLSTYRCKQRKDLEAQLKNKLPNEFRNSLSNYNEGPSPEDKWFLYENDYNIF
jgi:hypothetical protein